MSRMRFTSGNGSIRSVEDACHTDKEVPMDAVLRATAVFVFLVIVFRITGRRTLMEMTSFDFVLLLILSEATQNAMIGNDYSVTNGFLVILTLVGLDITLSSIKHRVP